MIFSVVKKYKNMILISIFAFYLGCSLTLNFLRIDCVSAENSERNSVLDKIEYSVVIVSGPNNEDKRDAVRATWINFVNNVFVENGEKLYKWNHTRAQQNVDQNCIKIFFVIGTRGLDQIKLIKLKSEQNRSNDLLLLDDLEDSYQNLAQKMLFTFRWISNNLKGLKYLVKCDDDSFVRIDLIVKDLEAFAPEMNAPEISKFVTFKFIIKLDGSCIEMLRTQSTLLDKNIFPFFMLEYIHSSSYISTTTRTSIQTLQKTIPTYKGLYWGYFDGRAKVYLTGKWEERDWFLCDTYLPYALGGGYIISRSIVDYIAKNSDVLSHYNSEDVAMGVWTAALDAVNRVHDIRFDTEWKSRGCDATMLVRHKQTPSEMFKMYRTLVQSHGEKLCKTESAVRKFYFYKWNVLPTMCCR